MTVLCCACRTATGRVKQPRAALTLLCTLAGSRQLPILSMKLMVCKDACVQCDAVLGHPHDCLEDVWLHELSQAQEAVTDGRAEAVAANGQCVCTCILLLLSRCALPCSSALLPILTASVARRPSCPRASPARLSHASAVRGERSNGRHHRAGESELLGFSGALWNCIRRCWTACLPRTARRSGLEEALRGALGCPSRRMASRRLRAMPPNRSTAPSSLCNILPSSRSSTFFRPWRVFPQTPQFTRISDRQLFMTPSVSSPC